MSLPDPLLLFASPVWQIDLGKDLNDALRSRTSEFKAGTNYFDLKGVGIDDLYNSVHEIGGRIQEEYLSHCNIRWNYIYGRQNPIRPGENDTAHWHPSSIIIGVYYINAEPDQGDLILHDPRGANLWPDKNALGNKDAHKQPASRSFYRISPRSGMLVLHPNYLVHSVETNLTSRLRMSLVIEFRS